MSAQKVGEVVAALVFLGAIMWIVLTLRDEFTCLAGIVLPVVAVGNLGEAVVKLWRHH